MLADASNLADRDPEMAATLFTRWLTMKAEQPLAELALSKEKYETLMQTL